MSPITYWATGRKPALTAKRRRRYRSCRADRSSWVSVGVGGKRSSRPTGMSSHQHQSGCTSLKKSCRSARRWGRKSTPHSRGSTSRSTTPWRHPGLKWRHGSASAVRAKASDCPSLVDAPIFGTRFSRTTRVEGRFWGAYARNVTAQGQRLAPVMPFRFVRARRLVAA
jgi:hypothetical protein